MTKHFHFAGPGLEGVIVTGGGNTSLRPRSGPGEHLKQTRATIPFIFHLYLSWLKKRLVLDGSAEVRMRQSGRGGVLPGRSVPPALAALSWG